MSPSFVETPLAPANDPDAAIVPTESGEETTDTAAPAPDADPANSQIALLAPESAMPPTVFTPSAPTASAPLGCVTLPAGVRGGPGGVGEAAAPGPAGP